LTIIAAAVLAGCKSNEPQQSLTIEQQIEKAIRANLKDTLDADGSSYTYTDLKILSCQQVNLPIDSILEYRYCEFALDYLDSLSNENFVFNETAYL